MITAADGNRIKKRRQSIEVRLVVELQLPPWLQQLQGQQSFSVPVSVPVSIPAASQLTPPVMSAAVARSAAPASVNQEERSAVPTQDSAGAAFVATSSEQLSPVIVVSSTPEQRICTPQIGEKNPQCFSDLTPRSTLCELMRVAIPQMAGLKAPRTLTDRSSFIEHWRRITGDPAIKDITGEHLVKFRDTLLSEPVPAKSQKKARPLAPKTVQKHHGIFKYFMSIAVQLKLIESVPQPSVFSRSILTPSQAGQLVKKVRDIIGPEEMSRIFAGCGNAMYPLCDLNRRSIDDSFRVLMWRCMILIVWTYGMRISDVERLHYGCFDFSRREHAPHGMVLFAPWKLRRKNRLQGLPLPELIVVAVSKLRARLQDHFAVPIYNGELFPFRWKAGCWNTPGENLSPKSKGSRSPHWISGWRVTFQRDILATQGIIPTMGSDEFRQSIAARPDALPGLTPHVFRQTAITEYNDRASGTGRRLGQFIAGQSGGAVDAASYDKPDKAVWEAIKDRVETSLPTVWSEWLMLPAT